MKLPPGLQKARPIADRIIGDPDSVARRLAMQHQLVLKDGRIKCWECHRAEALMPSLHCAHCLADAWRRLNIHDPQCPQREQSDADRAAMVALLRAPR